MLSRYQIKSTQSATETINQVNRIECFCRLHPPARHPPVASLARNLSARTWWMGIYIGYTKTLLYSLHLNCTHKTQTLNSMSRATSAACMKYTHTHTRNHTLSVSHLKYEWWFYFTYIQPSIITIITIIIMKFMGLSKMRKLNRYGWQLKPHRRSEGRSGRKRQIS